MKCKAVRAVYFSPTGTTEKIVQAIAETLAETLGLPLTAIDFTLPSARREPLVFSDTDCVVFGTPVIAGRIPNVLLRYLETVCGNGAVAIPVVAYGNRNYDDALMELRDILERQGLHAIAAGAFIGEHSFSTTLAGGRPDANDLAVARDFARKAAEKLNAVSDPAAQGPVPVEGVPHPYRGYYQPRDRAGNPVDIRKVKPLTNERCTDCKICAQVCPMGSISHEDVREFTGICIKCGACIKKCPEGAKYYDDEGYLYHKRELEEEYTRRAEPELFV